MVVVFVVSLDQFRIFPVASVVGVGPHHIDGEGVCCPEFRATCCSESQRKLTLPLNFELPLIFSLLIQTQTFYKFIFKSTVQQVLVA